jgi:hypothetical protein
MESVEEILVKEAHLVIQNTYKVCFLRGSSPGIDWSFARSSELFCLNDGLREMTAQNISYEACKVTASYPSFP